MAMSGFESLGSIQAIRPHDPGDADVALVPLPPQMPCDFLNAPSKNFEFLLLQIRLQYARETSEMRSEILRLLTEKNAMETEVDLLRTQNDHLRSPVTEVPTDESSRRSGASHASAASRKVPTLSAAIAKQHGNLREMHAEEIIEAMDKSGEVELLFKESDLRKMIRKSNTTYMPAETASEREERLKTMSRMDIFSEFLQSNTYEMIMALCLCINVFWMAFELQFEGAITGYGLGVYPSRVSEEDMNGWNTFFLVGDIFFTALFAFDVFLRIFMLKLAFWKVWMNYVDVAVTATSLIEVTIFYAATLPVNPVLFRLLRIGKLARAIRMVTMTSVLASLQLLVKCLASSSNMLFWSFCLLTFVQCVAGLIISTLCLEFIADESADLALRTLLLLPAAPAADDAGFAVLNIINAVFVQQTMKTASSDEEIAFKQKEKDIQAYTRKVKKMFQTMDTSGDGAINLHEFSKLVQSPKLKFWMGQLELEYHDLLSLFEFLDNGDGEITLPG
ncbi:unnamed protein product [Effrenium voratum]|nr:unnamed protein product [Effrenium voratum]